MGFTPDMDVAFKDPNYKYNFANSRYIFMRWKVNIRVKRNLFINYFSNM